MRVELLRVPWCPSWLMNSIVAEFASFSGSEGVMLSLRSIWRGAHRKESRQLRSCAPDPSGLKSLRMTRLRDCIANSPSTNDEASRHSTLALVESAMHFPEVQ